MWKRVDDQSEQHRDEDRLQDKLFSVDVAGHARPTSIGRKSDIKPSTGLNDGHGNDRLLDVGNIDRVPRTGGFNRYPIEETIFRDAHSEGAFGSLQRACQTETFSEMAANVCTDLRGR